MNNLRTLFGILFPLCCSIVLQSCAEPTADGDAVAAETAPAERPDIEGEQLLATAPEGWQQGFATNRPGLRLATFVPGDDSIGDWEDKVTFESFSDAPLPDPIDFVNDISADQSAGCEKLVHYNIQSGLENNYPTSVRLLVCTQSKQTQTGRVSLIKAIQGNDYFYAVTRAKRIAPIREVIDEDEEQAPPISDAEMAQWSTYMRTITVCDTLRAEHPCPAAPDAAAPDPA